MASGSVASEEAGGGGGGASSSGGDIGIGGGVGEKRKWAESKVYVRKSFKGIKDNGVIKIPTAVSTSDEDFENFVSSSGQENGRDCLEESRSSPSMESNRLGDCSAISISENSDKNQIVKGEVVVDDHQILEDNHADNRVEENRIVDGQREEQGHHVELNNGVESNQLGECNPVSMSGTNKLGEGGLNSDDCQNVKNSQFDQQIEENTHVDNQVDSQVELRIGAEESQIDMDLDNKDKLVEEISQVKESIPENNHVGDCNLGTGTDPNAESNHADHESNENEMKENNNVDKQMEEDHHLVVNRAELSYGDDNSQIDNDQDNRDMQVDETKHVEESNPAPANNHLAENNPILDSDHIDENNHIDSQIEKSNHAQTEECNPVEKQIELCSPRDTIQSNIDQDNRDIIVEEAENFEESNPEPERSHLGETNLSPDNNHTGESDHIDMQIDDECNHVDNNIEVTNQGDSIQSNINQENRDQIEESIPDPKCNHLGESNNQADDQIEDSNIKDIHMDGDVLEIESEKVVSDAPSISLALEDANLKKIIPECREEVIDKAVNSDRSENVTPVSVDPPSFVLPLDDAHSIEVITEGPESHVEVISDKAESSDHAANVIPMSVDLPSVERPLEDNHLKEIIPDPHLEVISDKTFNPKLSENLALISVKLPPEVANSNEIRPETHVEVISDRAVSPHHFENLVPVDLPTLNDSAKAFFPGFGGKIKMKLSSSSNRELREHKMKLENELLRVRGLMQRINYSRGETAPEFVRPVLNSGLVVNGAMGNTSLSGLANGLGAMSNGRSVVGNGLATRVCSGAASVGHVPYKPNVRPFNQLRVSVMENSQGMADSLEREKRTPKENQFYRNSEFLLAKDKFPPAESNKKSKSNGKKSSGGEFGFGGGSKVFKSCNVLLEKLMKHKHGWVFNTPVDVQSLGLHDYFIIIKNPMDLGTIKSRLVRNWYKSPMEFAEDVRLTFLNAMLYNPKGQDVHIMAEILLNMFEEKWADIELNYLRELRMAADHHEMGVPTPTSRRTGLFPASVLPPVETRILNRSESISHPVNPKPKTLHPAPSFRTPALKKPKAKDVDKRDMTYDEKQKLSTNLQSLPPEKLDGVIQIIKRRSTALSQNDDEIEVDIDSVDTETLWELDRFVTNYKKSLSKNRRKAELANQMRANGRQVGDKTMTHLQSVLPKESSGGAGKGTSSSPGRGNNPAENTIGSSSSSSSSSSGSSSSDSDSDSSSDESDAGHSPGN